MPTDGIAGTETTLQPTARLRDFQVRFASGREIDTTWQQRRPVKRL